MHKLFALFHRWSHLNIEVHHAVFCVLVASLFACGGGGESTSAPAPQPSVPVEPSPTPVPQHYYLSPDLSIDPTLPEPQSTTYQQAADAVRFLQQASFGANGGQIQHLMNIGTSAWIDEQIAEPQNKHLLMLDERFKEIGLIPAPVIEDDADGYYRDIQRSDVWWEVALWGKDQLRQRVAFALSQIFVISNVSDVLYNDTRGIANFQDLLATHAFGNYRDLLKAVTLNPMMGEYLSMVRNEKANPDKNIRPDENYAREVMQLFSIGLVELELDGSVRLAPNNQPIATYDQTRIKELARVFTGFNFATLTQWWEWTNSGDSEILPMKSFSTFHDSQQKQLLNGQVLSAGQSPEQDIDNAIDNLFQHANVAPFISQQLIQRLVTSNPSPAYVARIATIFNDNGQGVRGDMAAVIKGILLDDDARNGHINQSDTFGKLKEPVLLMAQLWRAFHAEGVKVKNPDGSLSRERIRFRGSDRETGQRPYGSFSVFNFYRPDFQPPGEIKESGLLAPEFQILTESSIIAKTNFLSNAIYYRDNNDADWLAEGIGHNWDVVAPKLNLQTEFALAKQPEKLLDRLNLLLFAGQLPNVLYQELLSYLQSLPNNNTYDQKLVTFEALYLLTASPEFSVQR
ncbi:DUF1800 domain-containing protein [Paraglaciecola hydrolytica]|uniref:DUF1800 domain-containing protein n=1 Tax=Paraglaciecola hydrolytica TaxID=1799789 RepID=UPI000AFC6E19|nr:DUF1800 domain-containing protein [Paraglaciecola hydrolytica]